MKIKTVDLRGLRNAESLQFNLQLAEIIKESNVDNIELPFVIQLAAQDVKLKEFSGAYKISNRSEYTAVIRGFDAGRDNGSKGLVATLRPIKQYHSDALMRAKAERLLYIIGKYGKRIPYMGDAEETAVLTNLVDEIESSIEFSQFVVDLNVTYWLDTIKSNNNAFKANYIDREMEASDKPLVKLSDVRRLVEIGSTDLFSIIETFELMQKGIYTDMILRINSLIDKYNKPTNKATNDEVVAESKEA